MALPFPPRPAPNDRDWFSEREIYDAAIEARIAAIDDALAALPTNVVLSDDVRTIVFTTRTDYDALVSPDPTTLYATNEEV